MLLRNGVFIAMLNQIRENRWLRYITLSIALGCSLWWVKPSYGSDTEVGFVASPDLSSKTEVMKQLNQQFSTGVVIPGYESLVERMGDLVQSTQRFEVDPTEAHLAAVRAAWLGAASSWATSNAIAFGPVHSLGYSTLLEFPADTAGIDTLLADAAESEAFDMPSLLPSLQGFEAMAYVLGADATKISADFSVQERRYLSALAMSAHSVSVDILNVWQVGWNENPAYGTLLSTAGQPGNRAYLSLEAGSEEIVRTIINSLDVVAAEELPHILEMLTLTAEAPDLVSLHLLTSNLRGIQSAYLGTTTGKIAAEKTVGVQELVAIANPDLSQQIQTSLDIALDGMEQAIADPHDAQALTMAQTSLEQAFTLLDMEVLPLVQR